MYEVLLLYFIASSYFIVFFKYVLQVDSDYNFTVEDVETSWSIKIKGSKVEPIKISCVKQKIIMGSIEPLINALFEACPEGGSPPSNEYEKSQILSICQQYNKCIQLLNFKGIKLSFVITNPNPNLNPNFNRSPNTKPGSPKLNLSPHSMHTLSPPPSTKSSNLNSS